jgi:hypothetical protein
VGRIWDVPGPSGILQLQRGWLGMPMTMGSGVQPRARSGHAWVAASGWAMFGVCSRSRLRDSGSLGESDNYGHVTCGQSFTPSLCVWYGDGKV